jgi:ATP-dependent RNA helicase DDX23/PRP28
LLKQNAAAPLDRQSLAVSTCYHDYDYDGKMDEAPLIDPALLANLTEAERAEALAAAAAAQRAEKRAEERRRLREVSASAAAAASIKNEDEEDRLLREAEEHRRMERERERSMELKRSANINSSAAAIFGSINNGRSGSGGGGSVKFVSKKKRGAAGQIILSNQSQSDDASAVSGAENYSSKANGDAEQTNISNESHLTASQLAQIKRAYLGNTAGTTDSLSAADKSGQNWGNNTNQSELSARERLKQERKKRRTKKTTFKFEWDAGDDTYDDDDPLYGMSDFAKNDSSSLQRSSNDSHNNRRVLDKTQQDSDRGVRFGKKSSSNYDTVDNVETVATKPLKKMTARDWRIFRENYNITTKGGKSPPPLRSFRENPIGVPPIHPSLIDAIENKLHYKEPSPIQRQAIPIGMQRRDLIGIAETGSGKTAAFGIPLCHHVISFPNSILESVAEDGPLALVMAPTRELALQINVELGKLLSGQKNVHSLAVVGGQSITEQATKLRNGVHIVVGTPGRINDCVEMAYLVLNQCSYIVLDEADRMIDLGFAPQIEQILDAMGGKLKSEDEEEAYEQERLDLESLGKGVPKHRLTAMFSATMPSEVERIAKRYLRHPVVVSVGDEDTGKNARITQRILYLSSPSQKESTLRDILRRSNPHEKIIVFVNEKKHADGVGRMVENAGRRCVVLHGGKTQEQREENLAIFRQGGVVLVATDVAGRGLDIDDVQQVINFDLPTRSIDNYCHRIGRTGRAGKEGLATSFITDEDEGIMFSLTQYLKSTGSSIPDRLARHPAASSSIHGEYIR